MFYCSTVIWLLLNEERNIEFHRPLSAFYLFSKKYFGASVDTMLKAAPSCVRRNS